MISLVLRVTISPPYWGTPRVFHHLPVDVETVVVVASVVVTGVVAPVVACVVAWVVVVFCVCVVVDVVDAAEPQDDKSIAATVKEHKPITRYLLFNFASF
jgi:hypothetical protein